MWFGPKGFASVVYGLLVLNSGIPAAVDVFNLVSVTITLSITAHSSTDIVVARQFDDERELPTRYGRAQRWASRRKRSQRGDPPAGAA